MKQQNTTLYADLTEMVFESREKAYGAYFLRKMYLRHLSIALTVSFVVFLSFSFSPLIAGFIGIDKADDSTKQKKEIKMTTITTPTLKNKEIKPIVIPQIPKIEAPSTIANPIPEPTPPEDLEDDEQKNTIHTIDTLQLAKNITLNDHKGTDDFIPFSDSTESGEGETFIPDVIKPTAYPKDTDFVSADEEPKPLNMEDITRLIGYPQMARDAGIKGMVVVRILVDKRGQYKRHKVINSVHPILDRAVEKHINKLKFTPAIQGKRAIPFWVNIPFRFELVE